MREYRSSDEEHLSTFRSILKNFCAGDVGRHEIRRELNALKLEVKNAGNRFHQERLCQARRTRDETMTASQERDEDLFDYFMLPDDDFGQFRKYLSAASGKALDCFSLGVLQRANLLRLRLWF